MYFKRIKSAEIIMIQENSTHDIFACHLIHRFVIDTGVFWVMFSLFLLQKTYSSNLHNINNNNDYNHPSGTSIHHNIAVVR